MHLVVSANYFAAIAHKTQFRKNTERSPYILHPLQVQDLLSRAGVTNPHILAAAVMHDVLEDTKVTADQMREQFGDEITNYVLECSDDKTKSKADRKITQLEHLSHISDGAALIKMADKYSNTCELMTDPPTNWSLKETRGYICWAFACVNKRRGINEYMDNVLRSSFRDLFKFYEIDNLVDDNDNVNDNALDKELNDYYDYLRNPPFRSGVFVNPYF